ncbi:hypothetical protein BH10PLA2_BH10PLA2_29420 [soil metagenome]
MRRSHGERRNFPSGKTFTSVSALYRLIRFAGAKRITAFEIKSKC